MLSRRPRTSRAATAFSFSSALSFLLLSVSLKHKQRRGIKAHALLSPLTHIHPARPGVSRGIVHGHPWPRPTLIPESPEQCSYSQTLHGSETRSPGPVLSELASFPGGKPSGKGDPSHLPCGLMEDQKDRSHQENQVPSAIPGTRTNPCDAQAPAGGRTELGLRTSCLSWEGWTSFSSFPVSAQLRASLTLVPQAYPPSHSYPPL